MIRQLARHASNLSIANLLVTIAGVVSFPILTRLLSVDDYGVMNLAATLLAILIAVSKLGVQTASVRFHADALAAPGGERRWASTVLFGMTAVGTLVAALWAAAIVVLPPTIWGDPRIEPLLLLVAALVVTQVGESAALSLLRAQLRTGATAIYAVIKRYVSLAATLSALAFVATSLWAFYGALLVVDVVAVGVLIAWVSRRIPVAPAAADPALYRSMLAFGLPMIGAEVSSQILTMGDRYLIQKLLGTEQLGLYTASYNLCEYVRVVCLAGFVQALMPMYVRTWGESGREATEAMLLRVTGLYALLALPTVAGLAAVGDVLVPLLASEKYAEGARIVPWVIPAMALEAYAVIATAGLMISKRTGVAMAILLGAAALNVALNLWWIPRWGIVGAAAATLACYVVVVVVGSLASRATLRPGVPWGQVGRYAIAAAAMYASVARIDAGPAIATLLARIAAGAAIYVAVVLAIDPEARRLAAAAAKRMRRTPA